jgi:hypothetical protein
MTATAFFVSRMLPVLLPLGYLSSSTQQPPVVLQLPASFSSNGGHQGDPQAHPPHRSSFSGSFTGLRLPKLLSLGSGGLHRHSTDSEQFGTPMSNVSRCVATQLAALGFQCAYCGGRQRAVSQPQRSLCFDFCEAGA